MDAWGSTSLSGVPASGEIALQKDLLALSLKPPQIRHP